MSQNTLPATVRMPIPERFQARKDRPTMELPIERLPQADKPPHGGAKTRRES